MLSCGATALVGLILGIVALTKINKSQGRQSGSGVAIAGIIVSGIFLLMIPVMAAMLLPALARAKERAQTIHCTNNMKQLATAHLLYHDAKKSFVTGGIASDSPATRNTKTRYLVGWPPQIFPYLGVRLG